MAFDFFFLFVAFRSLQLYCVHRNECDVVLYMRQSIYLYLTKHLAGLCDPHGCRESETRKSESIE